MHKTQRPRDDSNAAVEYSAYTFGCFTQSTQDIGLQWWLARNSHIVRQISASELQNIKKIDFVDFTIPDIFPAKIEVSLSTEFSITKLKRERM